MIHPFLQFRLLPITIVACSMFLGVKVNNVIDGKERLAQWGVSQAIAAEEESKADEETASEESGKESSEEDASEEDKALKEKEEAEAKAKEEAEAQRADQIAPTDKREFNQIELDILQSLSARREEIEKWADEVEMKENLLKATEVSINEKLDKMQGLKTEVEELLKRYDKQEQIELKSLVKIYESMKPKQAARIFDEMEMGILLDVVDLMSERKAAPILAAMSPTKAKDLTIEMAEKRRLRKKTQQKIPEDMAGAQ